MESQPQNPEFRINPENFHPCSTKQQIKCLAQGHNTVTSPVASLKLSTILSPV